MLLRYVDDIFDTETATATIGVDFRVSPALLSVTKLFLAIFISVLWCLFIFLFMGARIAANPMHMAMWRISNVAKRAGRMRTVMCGVVEWGKRLGVQ